MKIVILFLSKTNKNKREELLEVFIFFDLYQLLFSKRLIKFFFYNNILFYLLL